METGEGINQACQSSINQSNQLLLVSLSLFSPFCLAKNWAEDINKERNSISADCRDAS